MNTDRTSRPEAVGAAPLPRVCFVVESGTDVRLAEGLARRFDLTVLARRILNGVEISHPPQINLRIVTGPASRTRFARQAWDFLRARRGEFDFVLVQGYGLAALAANFAGRMGGTPTAMLVCSPVEEYYRCRRDNPAPGKPFRPWEFRAQQGFARLNARLGQQYIVLSEHLADVVGKHGASRTINIVPLYGVDTERFRPPTEPKSVIRQRLGLPASGSIIFFSSRIAPEKDSETLLLAFRRLVDAGHDLWLLHRSGGYRAFVKDSERFGVQERVLAADAVHPVRELPELYQASDLCVQASRAEGLGFSPLEALSCGVPVIATSVGGLCETIRDGETGWSYPVGDSAALATRIAEALGDPAEAERRTRAGREMVREMFDSQRVFAQLEALVRGSRGGGTPAQFQHDATPAGLRNDATVG